MLINFDNEIDKLQNIRDGKVKEGLSLDIPEIDEYFRFKKGNFNLVLGHANVGKTTVTLFLMLLYSIKHNLRWLVYSSENDTHTIIKKLIEFLQQKPLNKIEQSDFEKHAEFLFDKFIFLETEELYDYRQLLKSAEIINKKKKIDGFLIDPYNSLVKNRELLEGLNGHEYDYEATSQIRLFCKKSGISIWLTTHANTQALRIKHHLQHEYAGHPIPPLASDVEGGGKFVNRADDFMVIHRYTQHPTDWMLNHLHIRKIKDTDTGGRPTPIDNPITLKSIINNVGFEINGKKLLNSGLKEQLNAPF